MFHVVFNRVQCSQGPIDVMITVFQPIKIMARGGSCQARDESQYRTGRDVRIHSERDRKFFWTQKVRTADTYCYS